MTGIALDLGTKTGYAMTYGTGLTAGTWTLASSKFLAMESKLRMDRRLDIRVPNLYSALVNTHRTNPLDWVFFEDVQFSSTTKQTQLWASFRATVWLFASIHKINVECCPVSTLKKFATGYGGASKGQMLISARQKYASQIRELESTGVKLDDNAIDALHLLSWGITTVSRGQ